ncbi:thiol reductant ABC exporter subunit CydD [Leifsonia sp. F6_8S_P_1B]|uniref:Thiol reductant ABC exporter subunit CydD n=1 Tax=Leifsonia williamsii TaxID=3035919 RepID=A0ABT8KCM0_9MICO|nr:thiol reductant ABC exporter subunit CydD [Leifsonia williamsii]MDN4615218.1 thiol reductant ABC exporter subunit CydD [Leifsonia williamsii]
MRPLDPRLLRYATATRGTLAAGAALTFAQTALVIAFSWLVTQLVVRAIAGEPLTALTPLVAGLAVVVAARGAVVWAVDAVAARGGAAVVGQLRERLMAAVGRLGPAWLRQRSSTDVALVAGRGLDALDGYFGKYLPQLVATAVAMPVLVLVIGSQDLTSGIIVVLTLPLIPVFMMLVGWATQAAQQRQWEALAGLSRGFLDVVGGLSTLKLFGRQHRQEARIRAISDDYRVRTMKVLRMSFLSGFVLELAASLSVALVAVTIGLRLVGGSLDLSVGLFVLLLAPEAFLPLRNVGASYHAAAEGIEAAGRAFAVLEAADAAASDAGGRPVSVAATGLVFERVSVAYDDRVAVGPFSAEVRPGEVVTLTGPSGAGKSSLLAAVLGFASYAGRIGAGGREDPAGRLDAVAWAGQRPGLIAGSIAQNVALGAAEPDIALVRRSLCDAAAPELDHELVLGPAGAGLSGGQAQRVAVARALYRLRAGGCPVLLLDEPTSALDAEAEARLLASLRRVAEKGAAVLVVSHREAVAAAADRVMRVSGAEVIASPAGSNVERKDVAHV